MYWYPKFPAGWWLNGETTSIEQPMYRWYQTDRCSFHWKDILAMNGVDQERSSSSQTFLSLWKIDHFSQIPSGSKPSGRVWRHWWLFCLRSGCNREPALLQCLSCSPTSSGLLRLWRQAKVQQIRPFWHASGRKAAAGPSQTADPLHDQRILRFAGKSM